MRNIARRIELIIQLLYIYTYIHIYFICGHVRRAHLGGAAQPMPEKNYAHSKCAALHIRYEPNTYDPPHHAAVATAAAVLRSPSNNNVEH